MSAMPARTTLRLAPLIGTCLVLAAPQMAAGRSAAAAPFIAVGERADGPAGFLAMCAADVALCQPASDLAADASSDAAPSPTSSGVATTNLADSLGSTAAIVTGGVDHGSAKAASGEAIKPDLLAAWRTALQSAAAWSQEPVHATPAAMPLPTPQPIGAGQEGVDTARPDWVLAQRAPASLPPPPAQANHADLANTARADMVLADVRQADLKRFNRAINNRVVQREDIATYGVEELWRPSGTGRGAVGDCEDIALEKQIDIKQLNLPQGTARLAVVYHRSLGLHVVLVVRTVRGDMVLDSASNAVRLWSDTPYQWLRIQDGTNRMVWQKIA